MLHDHVGWYVDLDGGEIPDGAHAGLDHGIGKGLRRFCRNGENADLHAHPLDHVRQFAYVEDRGPMDLSADLVASVSKAAIRLRPYSLNPW